MDFSVPDVAVEIEIAAEPPSGTSGSTLSTGSVLSAAVFQNPLVAAVVDMDPSLQVAAQRCALAAKAKGTVRSYSSALTHFQKFCCERDLSFPDFSAEAVLQYVLLLDKNGASFGSLAKVKPALQYLESTLGRSSVFTPSIDLFLKGAENRALAKRGPVRKAPVVSSDQIVSVLTRFYLPYVCQAHLIEPVCFRTLFRLVFVYHTLCRYDCFSKLQAKHFELVGDDITVTFPAAKNDQQHAGQRSCLQKTDSPFCPVAVTKNFFRCFQLRFGAAAGDASFVSFQLRRDSAAVVPIFSRPLGYSSATADLRKLFKGAGVPESLATDKSIKMAGVTAAFAAGATVEDLMHAGRWRSPNIPLHYKHNSLDFKKDMADFC